MLNWRFVFFGILIFVIFGVYPYSFLKKSIKAIKGVDSAVVSLYADKAALVGEVEDGYKVGWWNVGNSIGEPELGPNDDLLFFNDANSVFYSGGNYSMVLGDFSPAEEYVSIANEEDEETQESYDIVEVVDENEFDNESATSSLATSTTATSTSISTATTTASTSPEIQVEVEDDEIVDESIGNSEDPSATSTGSPSASSEQTHHDGGQVGQGGDRSENLSETEQPIGEEEQIIQEDIGGVEELAEEPDVEFLVEDLPEEGNEDAVVEIIEIEENDVQIPVEEEVEDISFLKKSINFVRNIGSVLTNSRAQAASEKVDLEKFGELNGARIVFSLASVYINRSNSSSDEGGENSFPAPLDVDTTGSDEFLVEEGGETETISEEPVLFEAVEEEVLPEPEVVEEEEVVSEPIESETVEQEPVEAEETDLISRINNFLFQSVSAQSDQRNTKIIIWYSTQKDQGTTSEEALWHELGRISSGNISNALNGGYFEYDAPFLDSWEKIENLRIKLEGVTGDDDNYIFYLDSVWVDAEYDPAEEAPEKEEDRRKRWEEALELLSEKQDFKLDEKGELRFKYKKNKERLLEAIGEFFGLSNYWSDVNLKAELRGRKGEKLDLPLDIVFEEDGGFTLNLPDLPRDFQPGEYSIEFTIEDNSGENPEVITLTQDFTWGVIAMNFNKSIYSMDEKGYIQMAVLDDYGHTICDAELNLEIIGPGGAIESLSTESGDIELSEYCGPKSITNVPDYFIYYDFKKEGDYQFELTADTKNGTRVIHDFVEVRKGVEIFDIERTGATRINPKADYVMTIRLTANEDYRGDITEYVPSEFKITHTSLMLLGAGSLERDPFGSNYKYYEDNQEGEKILVWQDVDLREGDVLEMKYTYDAPDISPEFYLLGPLRLSSLQEGGQAGQALDQNGIFEESRSWQIASDAVSKRAKTVMFYAGQYNGGATAGNSTNVQYTLSDFNFRLAESGVDIKNAYILFEAQIEAYTNGSGNYTGYDLGFDACSGASCPPSAFIGDNVQQNDTSVLAYNEGESTQVRMLFDVTSETDIASYSGDGEELTAEVGYNIKHAATENDINGVKAILFLTYTYDSDSENLTNTVVYPLDSTNGTDRGSRQASIGSCTRNNNCPVFDYNMDIPEFNMAASTTNRLSQWFEMYDANDGNNATDLDPNLDIQTFDVVSNTYHHESGNGGTQGNMPRMIFPNWTNSGYSENSDQQVEYYINSGTNYAVGGEVIETYMASSSATTKTRTVRFPLGILADDAAVSTNYSKDTTVYFPENGSATGTVQVKSAWFRIIPHNPNTATDLFQVTEKVGDLATTSPFSYDYDGGGTVIKPSFNVIHIIATSSYSELEEANASVGKLVRLNTSFNHAGYGGVSAELMVTYTYTDESSGYLTSLNLYGGQSITNGNDQSETLSTANSVLPETNGKTILAGGLLANQTMSDSAGTMTAVGTNILADANLAISSPTCTNAYAVNADSVNTFTEFYIDAGSAMNTTDNQSYQACYSNDGSGDGNQGAKMNGQLIYTYSWENNPPTGSFNSATTRRDGTGIVDISIEVDDPNDHETRARLDFATGTTCIFTDPGDPTIDITDSNVTADFGDPIATNTPPYQIGTEAAYIRTASGSNSVLFDWQSQLDLHSLEGDYCLRLTVNDLFADQVAPATTTVYIDNIAPTSPGALSLNNRTGTSIDLNFGATSTETNFSEYKIFYKEYDGSNPTESDSVLSSSTDVNLGNVLFNSEATTTIGSLTSRTTYSFAIWTFDAYGNKASSTRVDIETNDPPIVSFNSAAQRKDGTGVTDVSIEVDDNNNDDTVVAKIDYSTSPVCDFSASSSPTLDTTPANISADWSPKPIINNSWEYQVGTTSAYIKTLPGSNTVDFDWLGATDEPLADGIYCLRVRVKDDLDANPLVATTTLTLDNTTPTSTGVLSFGEITTDSIELLYATTSLGQDTNEPGSNAYKIFYKLGTSGVTEGDIEHDNTDLNAYDYNGATSTLISGLDSDTDYVFNIWTYDEYGNKTSATEITVKTNNTIVNESLTFINATSTNIALAGPDEWIFRAVVSETAGWYAFDNVKLRLENSEDTSSPFEDIEFTWTQSSDSFSETGVDTNGAVTLGAASSTCAGNECTLDFKIIFDKFNFATTSVEYSAELYSANDTAKIDSDIYNSIYQVMVTRLEQIHYRWRNDDGGE